MIKISEEVHKRLQEDKKHFTKVIGYNFRFNDVIMEYHKILNTLREK